MQVTKKKMQRVGKIEAEKFDFFYISIIFFTFDENN
jgi:hypothetical protein